jgi:hypothetical protein
MPPSRPQPSRPLNSRAIGRLLPQGANANRQGIFVTLWRCGRMWAIPPDNRGEWTRSLVSSPSNAHFHPPIPSPWMPSRRRGRHFGGRPCPPRLRPPGPFGVAIGNVPSACNRNHSVGTSKSDSAATGFRSPSATSSVTPGTVIQFLRTTQQVDRIRFPHRSATNRTAPIEKLSASAWNVGSVDFVRVRYEPTHAASSPQTR